MDNNQKSWPHHSEHIFILPLKWDVVASIDWSTYRRNRHATLLNKRLRMADVVASLVENDAWKMMCPVPDIIGLTAKPDDSPENFFCRFVDHEDSRLYKEYCFFIATFEICCTTKARN